MSERSAVVLGAVALLALGCTTRRSPDQAAQEAREPVVLEITNNHWSDMVIYVTRNTQRIRVMTVVATQAGSVTLRPDLLGPGGEVRVLAYAIGGNGRYVSPAVYAPPGATVGVNLETDLRRSSIAVW